MTDATAVSACRPWCALGTCSHPDNCSTVMITTGATARRIEQWEPSTSGVYYPGVTVRGVVGVDERSAVCLHLGDSVGDIDVEVFMRPHEVDDLIQNLRIVLGQMTPPSRGMCLND